MTPSPRIRPVIHAILLAVLMLSLIAPSLNADAGVEKPKHFDSDRLMALLAGNGIHAQWDCELMVRGDILGRDRNSLVNVMVLRVKQPLSTTEWHTACVVVGNFLASQQRRMHVRYEFLGVRAESGDGKIHFGVIIYPSDNPYEANTP